MIQQPIPSASTYTATRLNPLALAAGFGVAGVVLVFLFGIVMGFFWGMMGAGGTMGGGGGMMGGGGGMMGGAGFFVYALLSGFLGGAIAGGAAAWVYNAVMARKT